MSTAERIRGDNSGARLACRPFIKWAGGKSQLLSELIRRIPPIRGQYFEPFLGGGALLFALQPSRAHISDINEELINCYEVVRDRVDALIRRLREHYYDHDYYYSVRDADRTTDFLRWSAVRRASRFIFLNRTCFNGLYRVNSRGHFNVPFGRYKDPTIVDADNLRACSEALAAVAIRQAHFLEFESDARRGDFVYFDPPYAPLSATSSFTTYSVGGFHVEHQRELFELCTRLDRRGVKFMLSNSAAPLILKLYRNFRVEKVAAARAINSKAERRGRIDEVIVRNY